jgi:RND family efflux transporter MFP subunit
LLLFLPAGLATALWVDAASGQPPGRQAMVRVAQVVERVVAPSQDFVGTVHPRRKSTVGSTEEGRVVEFSVNEGDYVEQGDELAQLRITALEIELAQAEAEEDLRLHELRELEAGSRPEEKAEARAELQRAEALMKYETARRQRAEDLFSQEPPAIAKEEWDQAVSAAAAAESNHSAAQARYDLVMAGPREEKKDQAKARLKAQQETVALLEDQIAERTIRAPFAGYVTAEHTEQGQWVAKGAPIVDIVDLEKVEVRVSVPEKHISNVTAGMKVPVQVVALPTERSGEILRIVPQADVQSRTFPVIVEVENRRDSGGYLLKAGMLAWVTLVVGEPQVTRLVPKDALVLGGDSPLVYVVVPDPEDAKKWIVVRKPVQIGVAENDLVQVTGEVAKGQLVVVEGNERVMPGQPVTIVDYSNGK